MSGRSISTVLLALMVFSLGVTVSARCPCLYASPSRANESYYDSYDPRKAHHLMEYCYYTYFMEPGKPLPEAFKEAHGYPFLPKIINGSLPWYNGGEMLCVVGYDYFLRGIVVAFRGTNKASHWMANLRATSTRPKFLPPDEQGEVHTGFLNAYMGVKDQVHAEVENLKKHYNFYFGLETPNLFFTGHSLGGAMASLAAADFAQELAGSVPITVYTFASPRVGDTCFVSYFAKVIKTSFRVVVNGDLIVPRVPLKKFKFNCQFESMPGKVRVPRPKGINWFTVSAHMHPSYLKQLSLFVGYTPSGLELKATNRTKGEPLPEEATDISLQGARQPVRQCAIAEDV